MNDPEDPQQHGTLGGAQQFGQRYRLTLYVIGDHPRSERAIENVRALLEAYLPGRYDLRIVDVSRHPDAAETARVLATPTLVREAPQPQRRIAGDFSDSARVLRALGLAPN